MRRPVTRRVFGSALPRSAQVSATRYRISGSRHPIDLWYCAQQEWLVLESIIDGGRRLRYRLI